MNPRNAFAFVIFAGLVIAGGEVHAVPRPGAAPATATSITATSTVPAEAATPAAPSSSATSATAAPTTAPASAASAGQADALPPGQVWECTGNGQHVFSDKPCGAHASIRQLNALNTMPAPAMPTLGPGQQRPYGRMPPSWYPEDDGYAQDYAAQQDEDSAGMSGPVVYVGAIRRPVAHPRRPPPHHHTEPRDHAQSHPAPGPGATRGR